MEIILSVTALYVIIVQFQAGSSDGVFSLYHTKTGKVWCYLCMLTFWFKLFKHFAAKSSFRIKKLFKQTWSVVPNLFNHMSKLARDIWWTADTCTESWFLEPSCEYMYIYFISANPLITWPSITKGRPVQCVRWSRSRPCVFYVLDTHSTLYVFDILEGDVQPKQVESLSKER